MTQDEVRGNLVKIRSKIAELQANQWKAYNPAVVISITSLRQVEFKLMAMLRGY